MSADPVITVTANGVSVSGQFETRETLNAYIERLQVAADFLPSKTEAAFDNYVSGQVFDGCRPLSEGMAQTLSGEK